MIKIMKTKVWFAPIPTIGLKGVLLEFFIGKLLLVRKILFRDINDKCYVEWLPYMGCIIPRS
jgi:hypothetical protein